eukprot:3502613-Pyramimonas_sp.AAC.1
MTLRTMAIFGSLTAARAFPAARALPQGDPDRPKPPASVPKRSRRHDVVDDVGSAWPRPMEFPEVLDAAAVRPQGDVDSQVDA